MDINERYTRLCAELGNLDIEIEAREKRREIIRAELVVLQRIAAEIKKPPAPEDA